MMSTRLIAALAASTFALAPAHAEYLFADPAQFPIPEFAKNPPSEAKTEWSEWDVFYAPHTEGNYPDVGAPNGGVKIDGVWRPVQRSQAGFPANNPIYNPDDPLAFWDLKNATIRQTSTSAIIVSPDGAGNIYSFAGKTSYVLSDSTADAQTPYKLGTVMFQFQTDGTLVDFSSIELRYTDGNGVQQTRKADEHLREFLGTASADPNAANAFTNRVALQWDLTGLDVDTYEIVWTSESSSMSFQRAVLDTSNTYGTGVPESRTWTAASGNWTAGANWAQGTSSIENANVRFGNATSATVSLDANRTIGEMIFESAADVTINRPGAQKITSNTGISTKGGENGATGNYVINAAWEFGATNLFEIHAGTVRLNGPITGNYGMLKKGDGTLVFGGNASFSGGVTLWGGTMRLEGTNTYFGGTAILTGRMEVAADSPLNAAGAFGLSTQPIALGSDGDNFSVVGGGPAALFIDGDHTVAKAIHLAAGGFEKRLGAFNTSAGAVYSGAVSFGNSASNVKFTAEGAADRMVLSGTVTGGSAASTLEIDGAGTVVLSGATAKSFANATTVKSGTLEIANGTSFTGPGNWTVAGGARLRVNGTFAGTGALTLNGGTLAGTGTVQRSLTLDAGDRIAPGDGAGAITLVGAQTWGPGGGYEWQIVNASGIAGTGWDLVEITGALTITATAGNRFTIFVESLDLEGFDAGAESEWILATASGGITGFSQNKFLVDAAGFEPGGDFEVTLDGNSLVLAYAPVPEPSTVALLGGALAILGWRTMRRRSKGRAS